MNRDWIPKMHKLTACFILLLLLSLTNTGPAQAKGGDKLWQYVDAQANKQEAKAMALASAGNVIVAGYTNLGGVNNDYWVVKFKSDGSTVDWRATYGGSGDDAATAVAIDSADNVIVTGYAWNGSNYDIHIIKYNGTNGTVLWEDTFNGAANGNDFATAIAVDGSDNIYVGGYSFNSSGNDDYLVLKYASGGSTPVWQEIYDSSYHSNDRITAMVAGSDGIAVTGYSSKGGTDFDILTRKYGFDKSLVREWRYSSTGSRDDRGVAVRMDTSGYVYVTGTINNSIDTDIYTAKLNPASDTPVWENIYDGTHTDEAKALWVDSSGNVYVTGYTFTFAGNEDFFTVRYNADGTEKWKSVFNSSGEYTDIPTGIVVDNAADGGVFVTGYSTTAANEDFMTIKYHKENGTLLWEKSFNGTGNKNDRAVGIAIYSDRNLRVAGWSDGATSYDFQAVAYDFGPLNAPTNLTVAAASNTSITLNWLDTSDNEDSFLIERKLGEGGTYAQITTVGANVTTYTDTGLTPNNYYYYRVRAYNDANKESAYSNEDYTLTKVVTYEDPAWSYRYDGAGGEDFVTGIAVGLDDHPVVTGYSLLAEAGVDPPAYSFDYLTIKLNRADKSFKWKAIYDSGDGGTDMAAGVMVDSSNDVYVTGTAYLYGGGAENSEDMYTLKYLAGTHSDPGTSPPKSWDHQYGNAHDLDNAAAIVAAPGGNNGGIVIGSGKNSSGNIDIYLIRFAADGTRPWTPKVYDSTRDDSPTSAAFDAAGNIYVTGYTKNVAGNFDWLVAKFNGSNGNLIWADTIDGGGHGNDRAVAITVDADGNAFATGYLVNAAGNEDYYTVKYDGASATVDPIWDEFFDGPAHGNDRAVAVSVDAIDGAVVVAGTSYTTLTDSDMHLIRYNPASGEIIKEINFDRPGYYDYVTAMAMDSSGYIYLAGNTRTGPDSDAESDSTSDIISLIFDYKGTFLGAAKYDGAGRQDEAKAITVNYQGEAFIAGLSRNSSGNSDFLVLKQKNNYLLVPAPLTATPQADYSKVDLTWRENTPSTSFRIERTTWPVTSESVWAPVTTEPSGTTSHTDTGLTAGTAYCYQIDAYNGSINSRKIQKCVTTSLQKPVLSPLTVDSTTQITMNWSQITGNTGYKVERKITAGGTWSTLTTKGANVTSHVDTGLTPGTVYYYRVSTNSAVGYSLPSDEQNAVTKPAAPTLNAPANITKSQMYLAWNTITGAANYTLEIKSTGAYAPVGTCTAIAGTNCTVTGLTSDTVYYFHVKATNASGDSDWSNETNGRALLPEPTLSSATAVSATQVDLVWTDTASETGYEIWQSSCGYNSSPSFCDINSDGTPWPWSGWSKVGATLAANTTNKSITGLTTSSLYKYKVRAVTGSNNSAYSNGIGAWTWFTAPASITISPASVSSLTLSWSDTNNETNYTIERRAPPVATWTVVTTTQPLNNTTFTDTGLGLQTQYCYRLKPTSSLAPSLPDAYTGEYCKTTPLPAPTLNAPTTISTTQVDLTWSNVTGNTGYDVERCTTNDPDNPNNTSSFGSCTTLPHVATDTTSTSSTGLTAGYTYSYRVRDTYGTSDYSGWSSYQYATTVPPAPTLNTPSAASTSQINLSWNNVVGETGYKLEWKQRSGSDCTAGTWNGPIAQGMNATSYSHTGLSTGTYYCYRIRSTKTLDSAYSNVVSQTTTLAAPTLNALSGVTTSKIDLSWNNIANNTGYKIERKIDAGGTWGQIATVGQDVTNYSNTGLSAGTLYYYRVSSGNAGGYSVASNEQSATTTPTATTSTATVISDDRIDLSWQLVYGATHYKIEQKIGTGGSWSLVNTVAAAYTQSYCGYIVPRLNCQTQIADSSSYSDTGLTENTVYCYQIKAWNSTGGDSAASAERCVTTSAMATQSLTATPVNSLSIKLDWTPLACAPNPCDVPDGFEIEKQAWNGEWALIKTIGGDKLTFTDTVGVDPLKRYKYRVRTFKGSDKSAYSNIATALTPAFVTGDTTCK